MIGTASGYDLAREYDRVCGDRQPRTPISDQSFEAMAANGVQIEDIEKNVCGFCLELNIGTNGRSTWTKDMGHQACGNPYCGAI